MAAPSDYLRFVREKLTLKTVTAGIKADISETGYGFQRVLVAWALERGKAALFAECGMGKTWMQLEWARHVAASTGRPVLILAPLAVAGQTVREGQRFGVEVRYAADQSAVVGPVAITNYERLEKFDSSAFAGIVLDESSAIKGYTSKTRRLIQAAFAQTPYKLACTATPAPNDHMELGQHAEFLDVLTSHEMLARWFINDTSTFGTYRLKGHAAADFWAWVSSWARCVGKPSDLGFPDDGYDLPPLDIRRHLVETSVLDGRGENLFRVPDLSATSVHKEKRLSAAGRAACVGQLVRAEPAESWLVWCETNYEEDALRAELPDATFVRGDQSLAEKEAGLSAFGEGRARVLVTKPSLAGFGLNFQHCARVAFVGATFSYEQFYQAVRRTWRFGQLRPVVVHVAMAQTEAEIWDILQRKAAGHESMKLEMFAAMRRALSVEDCGAKPYEARRACRLPTWLRSEAT